MENSVCSLYLEMFYFLCIMVGIKKGGYILRLINNYSAPQKTNLTIGLVTQNIVFGMYEVKTLFYDGNLYKLDTMEV